MKLKTIFKRVAPVLAVITAVALGAIVFSLNNQNKQSLQKIGSLESKISSLESQKNESEKNLNKMLEDAKKCHTFLGHDCLLIREDSNNIVAQYRRTNANKSFTYRWNFPSAFSISMWSTDTFFLQARDEAYTSVFLNMQEGEPQPCFFPTKPANNMTIQLFKKYHAMKTEFGTVQPGWKEADARDPHPSNQTFFLCQETQEGNNQWTTESAIGVIEITFPEDSLKAVDSLLQSIKNIKVTDVENFD